MGYLAGLSGCCSLVGGLQTGHPIGSVSRPWDRLCEAHTLPEGWLKVPSGVPTVAW